MHPMAFVLRSHRGASRDSEGILSLVVVKYRYSTSSDRSLTKDATWTGQVPGRSLATVMSELRRLHRRATNIAITTIEWRHGDEASIETHEHAADLERPCTDPSNSMGE
jgi:hypothetical protein